MKWWSDLWLNEGFASFVENVGVNFTNPEWKMMDQFYLDKFQKSMALDQLSNSHPIMAEVKDPAQINSLFDSISYDKVVCICLATTDVRMKQVSCLRNCGDTSVGELVVREIWNRATFIETCSCESLTSVNVPGLLLQFWYVIFHLKLSLAFFLYHGSKKKKKKENINGGVLFFKGCIHNQDVGGCSWHRCFLQRIAKVPEEIQLQQC